jgi:glutamate-1-semialdehyde 2,1-aminomutase
VYQAGTLSGNPLAMAAGIATLKKLDTNSYILLSRKAKEFRKLLQPSLDKYSDKILFLQMESIFALYFTNKKTISSVNEVKQSDMNLFAKFHKSMLEKGVYLAPSGYEVGFLSTAHSEKDLVKTAHAIAESLEEILG